MRFIYWHYTFGLKSFIQRWYFSLVWIIHYFSLILIPRTLFSPWKKLADDTDSPGFQPELIFRRISFNIISRTIGAIVRTLIFITGLACFLLAFFSGIAGIILWLVFPLTGLLSYLNFERFSAKYFQKLSKESSARPQEMLNIFFTTPPGKFIIEHLGVSSEKLIQSADTSRLNLNTGCNNASSLIKQLLPIWEEKQLHQFELDPEDFLLSAKWWDAKFNKTEDTQLYLGRPGLGLELLYGYTPQLNRYSTDLSLPQKFSHHLIGREEIVNRILRSLNSGNSIVLYGLPGVGKQTIVLEFARRAAAGELGSRMGFQRVLEFDYHQILSASSDLNAKKQLLSDVLKETSGAGNIILVIKDLHRLVDTASEGVDFTDVFEKYLETRQLKIIAISSPSDYERFIARNSRLKKYLEPIEAAPLDKDQALNVLIDFAHSWEQRRQIVITAPALREVLDGSDKYITDTPYPEKSLELLDRVISYVENRSGKIITRTDVKEVLSEITGISTISLSEQEKSRLSDLENILHKQLIGQDAAINLIAKSLRAASVGIKNENRPIGSFLFLGPTGVGKTQTAKTLAEVYYGKQSEILRFDMAEYAGPEGLERLMGSVHGNYPGLLSTAIKNKPASLLLLDEIEKAPPQILNLLLTLLDEGYIVDAFGKKVICRHLFVIATSNAGSEFIRTQVINKISGEPLQKAVLEEVLHSRIFSPEFLNRFDGVVVFEPLKPEELVQIARLMLTDLAETLKTKDIKFNITEALCSKIAADGFEPEFGARAMRRLVDLNLGDLVGSAILKNEIKPGQTIEIVPQTSPGKFSLRVL
jgi:ATP-dependent Clp protease ATP-binding subunit ClpC